MSERRRVCGLCNETVGPGWNYCEKHRFCDACGSRTCEHRTPDSMSPHEIAKRMGWKIETVPVYCGSCLADVTDAPHSTHECKPRGGFEFL